MYIEDNKNRIYALYRILKYKGLSIPEPNYFKSVKDIFTEITLAYILNNRYLDFLYLVPSINCLAGLSS